ncbi:hypothetical protein PSP31121_05403 [Pandoraea sputorum]|uniref:Uncharacterized protein n=1 Tax=Pandoraea sputorum TaxID=93222 RepID=A0A5E5BHS8_9BURK|nr:hypothetical protein PSP31121_05403 [Pandoraea sputorum]
MGLCVSSLYETLASTFSDRPQLRRMRREQPLDAPGATRGRPFGPQLTCMTPRRRGVGLAPNGRCRMTAAAFTTLAMDALVPLARTRGRRGAGESHSLARACGACSASRKAATRVSAVAVALAICAPSTGCCAARVNWSMARR